MAKKHSPSLSDFSRQTSNQSIVLINLVVAVFLIIVLFITFATEGFGSGAGRVFAVFLTLLSVFGIILSTSLILRKARNSVIEKFNKGFEWAISVPEIQRQKLNREVLRIAAAMEIPEDQLSDLLLAYIVAEDLSLREIQQEAGQPLIRHARIGEAGFYAILLANKLITCVEVTFVVEPFISAELIDSISEKIAVAKSVVDRQFPGSSIKLMLVIATQLDALNEAELRANLTKDKDKFAQIPANYFEITIFSFEELQRIYTV